MNMMTNVFEKLIDFTRTSGGGYFGPDGLFRFTPASRNLLLYTQEFDNGAWAKGNATVTANAVAAPDGTLTADAVLPTATTAAHNVQQSGGGSGAALTISTYAKAGSHSFMQLSHGSSSAIYANFNLLTGAVGTVGASATASITPAGDGWYRCAMTFTPGASASIAIGHITSATAGYRESWAATGTESIYLWGAQLELGSTATSYARNAGGLYPPRFDYDPVTLAPRGLLIEEQRTNLLTYSEDWTNAAWSKTNITVTAAATTSPDGTVDAQKLEATATAVTSIITPTTTVAATAATFSVYVKQGTGATTANIFTLRNVTSATNLIRGTLNYSTGDFTYTTGSTGVTVTNVGNGWWRIVMTATSGITSGDTIRSYVGFDGGSQTAGDHLFAWGAQLEAGAFATSYIPTVASQVTRTADVATITGANFSRWYNQSEGTFVVEADSVVPTSTSVFRSVGATDGTSGNALAMFIYNSRWGASSNVGGVSQADLQVNGSHVSNVPAKSAFAYKVNDIAFSVNGSAPLTDAAASIPVVDRLAVGSIGPDGGGFLNGRIRRIRYYPTRLSNTQLQALTA